jgi:hypothetical protein
VSVVELDVRREGGDWVQVGAHGKDDAPGSFSSEEERGRQVYVFGWLNGEPGVWRSKAGADIESSVVRAVFSERMEKLSDLSEPYEMIRATEHGPICLRMRLVD